ncbi:hypothetical protein F2Q68_00010460 [Brassica cretica]|uniref:Uncharacterized protein n=1 Tax=Brassica cretica TaxID=69181 RepID=A0A8S9L4H0_BRACR|nr:hypothetical protein F2Q68_00010460 [Brassica cretica]
MTPMRPRLHRGTILRLPRKSLTTLEGAGVGVMTQVLGLRYFPRLLGSKMVTTKLTSKSPQHTRIQIGHGQAQLWPSDHTQAKLSRYVATEHAHGSVAMQRLSSSQSSVATLLELGISPTALTAEASDEDLKSLAGPPAHKINHTSYIGASSDIGASEEGYLCDHEDFCPETTSYRFSTQPEHAENWFHTKRSSGLGDTPFTIQATYTASELVLFKESNSLLKECATQTHVWKPGYHSLHLGPVGELIPCTKPHWFSQILHHLNLPFLEQI